MFGLLAISFLHETKGQFLPLLILHKVSQPIRLLCPCSIMDDVTVEGAQSGLETAPRKGVVEILAGEPALLVGGFKPIAMFNREF